MELGQVTHSLIWGSLTSMPITLLSLASCVSYAELIKPTPLSVSFLAGASYFSAGLTHVITNLASKCPFMVTSPDMTFTLFVQSVQGAVVAATAGLPEQEQHATAFVALHVGAMLLGLVFVLLGKLRMVAALNYLPYPVVAGFLAMIGAAVIKGSTKIVYVQDNPVVANLTIGVAVGLASVVIGLKQFGVATNVSGPALIVGSLAAFWGWAAAAGRSLEDLQDEGWLLPRSPQASNPLSIFSVELGSVHWLKALPGIDALALVVVATINRALTVSAIESTVSDEPYSVDQEMSSVGLATVVGGFVGGVPMNPTSAMTTLCKEGSKGNLLTARFSMIITSTLHLLLWVSGFPLTDYLPRFLLGGLLMVMGGGMLMDWAILVTRKLQWSGVVVIYSMVFLSLYTGMTHGIALGLLLALCFMNMRFAKLEVLKYHVSGIHFRSSELYTVQQSGILRKYGDRTQIIGLTGFIFEGVAISLTRYLKRVVDTHADLQALVIDCAACQGLNDSACFHLAKVVQYCGKRSVKLTFCNLDAYDQDLLRSWKLESRWCEIVELMESALEAAEQDTLVHGHAGTGFLKLQSLNGQVERDALAEWLGADAADTLVRLAPFRTVEAGEPLSQQGALADKIFVAVPEFSDVVAEVKTGTQNKPAELFRTMHGAVCAPEALLGTHCRAVWRVRSESVGLFVDVQKLKAEPRLHSSLLKVGFDQQLAQADHLSSLYTLSRGGGWRGVTFDADTCKKICTQVLSDNGPRLSFHHMVRRQEVPAASPSNNHYIAAVLDRQTPKPRTRTISKSHSEGGGQCENLILNRFSATEEEATYTHIGDINFD
mmetsp:Transcript_117844/g.334114  ORF Transcript_117844/g.334114 Transcript_117844/m.334114 type:complete len:828 (-) Transcript_117844:121-2604(-)